MPDFQPAEFPHIASTADHPIHDELRAVHEARCLLDAVRDLSDVAYVFGEGWGE